MFQKVISHKGFWKSVISLTIAFALIFTLFKWILAGFDMTFFSEINMLKFLAGVFFAGFVYGFFVTFGKFRSKLKSKEQ